MFVQSIFAVVLSIRGEFDSGRSNLNRHGNC